MFNTLVKSEWMFLRRNVRCLACIAGLLICLTGWIGVASVMAQSTDGASEAEVASPTDDAASEGGADSQDSSEAAADSSEGESDAAEGEPAAEGSPDAETETEAEAEGASDDSGEDKPDAADDGPGDEDKDEAGDEPTDEAGDEPTDEAGDEPGDEADGAGEAADAGPAAVAFEATFTRWKDLLKTLRDIRAEYAIAEEAQLPALKEQWKQRIADGRALKQELDAAAAAAYKEAPNEDREVVRYLITLAADEIRSDNYTGAMAILQSLVDGQCDERDLPDMAGIAAFCTNDFDAASAFFAQAQENNSLSTQGTHFMGDVATCKENWAEEEKLRAKEAMADDLPRVKFETTVGDIVIELFENEAPETVGNFISLVEKGFYDGLAFHRVIEAFMAQGGCPKGDGTGDPGYSIYCECVNDNFRKHFAGSLSMAKQTAVNTGGSQFFITFVPTVGLDGKHTVFGRVIEGMDNVIKIVRINPQDPESKSIEPTRIIKATVVRKRDHAYRPNKVKS